jgi:hypothetical protein
MFFMPKFLHFDSANLSLNRGNTNPFKEGGRFSDTGDNKANVRALIGLEIAVKKLNTRERKQRL